MLDDRLDPGRPRGACANAPRRCCEGPFEELWIGSWDTIGERLLREHSEAAGLDPFFDVLGPAERLAMLLDRLDQLPLRRHEIRGNPAGLLARLLARIDGLKAERVGPTTLEERARGAGAGGDDEADREAARRELEFAELYTAHDRILAEAGSLDRGDVFLALDCLLVERPDVRRRIAERFEHLMVDELEETTPAQRAVLEALAADNPNQVFALEGRGRTQLPRELVRATCTPAATGRARAPLPRPEARASGAAPTSARRRRRWRARSSTWSPPAPPPEEICVLVADPARQGGAVAAAMEERGIPFHLSGPTALFQRPEVRDAIAWLRVLADPDDSAAAARALTRPPVELRSGRPGAADDDRAAAQAGHGRRLRSGARQPPVPARGAGADPVLPQALQRRRGGDGGAARRRLRAAADRARSGCAASASSPPSRRSPSGCSGSPAWPSWRPPGRGASRTARPAASSPTSAPSPRPGSSRAGGEEPPLAGRGPGDGGRRGQGARLRPRLRARAGGRGRLGADRLAGAQRASCSRGCERGEDGEAAARRASTSRRWRRRGGAEEEHEEELFGPAEGLHATYRTLREQVLEASWRAGRELSEPRLDTAIDVNRAIARYLELLKLAALAQRPGDEPTAEAIEAVNGLLRQVATPEQQAELDASSLDAYLLDSEQRARPPPASWSPPARSPRWRPSCRAAATAGSASRPPTSAST